MKDYYKNTRECIDHYNTLQDKLWLAAEDTTEDEDEFLINFCVYLAHALIKDTGTGGKSREELSKTADIINDVVR